LDRITIVATGPIGVSIGIGLKRLQLPDTEIVGTAGDRWVLVKGAKMGAFDSTTGNLRSAMANAGLVVLDTAVSDTRKIMEAIAPILEKDCVVTDTGPNKLPVLAWAEEYFGKDVNFVGGRPVLREYPSSLDDASAAVFDDIEYCVVPARNAAAEAVRTVVGMIEVLGAKPLFLDAAEHDSYSSAAVHMPRLLSSALVGSLSQSSAWREIARLAGGEFKEVSQFAAENPEDSAAAYLDSPDTVAHWIDQAITELISYRDHIKSGDDGLAAALTRAYDERAKWVAGVIVEDKRPEIPTMGETISGMFFGRRLSQRFKQMSGES
jgi:prephenate dehydrogenase